MTVTQQTMFQGPIPAPEILARYDQLVPGSAERIIAMAEAELQHRITMDRGAQTADIQHRAALAVHQDKNARAVFRSDLVGQLLGAAVALGALACAAYSVYAGAWWPVSVAFVGLPVAAIVKAVRENGPPKAPKKQ